jgi:hypothetical protein
MAAGGVAVAGEAVHVGAELGQDHLGGALRDAGNRAEQLTLALERANALLDLCRQCGDRLVEVLDVREKVRDEQRVVGREASLEREPQGRQLRPQLALGELGERLGVRVTLAERAEHRLARGAEHVRGDVPELDVRVLEQLLETVRLA